MAYIEGLLTNMSATLKSVGGILSLILIILAGIVYGLSMMQPSESRGKWQTVAVGLLIGGAIMAAVVMASGSIQEESSKLLTFILP
jgi:zinc transporter ZupT